MLLFFISTKRVNIIRKFKGIGFISMDGDTKKLSYNKKAFVECYKEAYLNKIAFVYIVAGFMLDIFANDGFENRICQISLIVLSAIIIILATEIIVSAYIRKSKKANQKITYEELVEAGCEPDMASVSSEELQSMLDDVFKK